MAASPDSHTSALFGRDAELSRLREAWAATLDGSGGTILVAGEAGVGKTRLVDELLEEVRDEGGRILRGWCLAESLAPLVPLREALSVASLDSVLDGREPPRLEALIMIGPDGEAGALVERNHGRFPGAVLNNILTTLETFVDQALADAGDRFLTLGFGDWRVVRVPVVTGYLIAVLTGPEDERFLTDLADLAERLDAGGAADHQMASLLHTERYSGLHYTIEDASLRRQSMQENVAHGLRRLAGQVPVVLFLDDLQWADPTTIDTLTYLIRNLRDTRVLVLGTYRPEDLDEMIGPDLRPLKTALADWRDEGLVGELVLDRLGLAPLQELIDDLLPGPLPGDLVAQVHAASAGNALYAKVIIDDYLASGQLQATADGLRFVPVGEEALPAGIRDIVTRRLDRLDPGDRELLDLASVLGDEVDPDLIACVGEGDPLLIADRLRRTGSGLVTPGAQGFRFDHRTIRDALYQGLGDELKAAYHLATAECILTRHPDPVGPLRFDLAFHFDRAEDGRAYTYASMAAEEARSTYAVTEARRQYGIALRHAPDPLALGRLQAGLAQLEELAGHYDRALALLDSALEVEEDPLAQVSMICQRAVIHERQGDLETSLMLAQRGLAMAPEGSMVRREAELRLAQILYARGELEPADLLLESMASEPDLSGRLLANSAQVRADIAQDQGRMERALQLYGIALDAHREVGNLRGVAGTLNNMGIIHWLRGDLDQAESYYTQSARICDAIGLRRGQGLILGNLGIIYYSRGEVAKARQAQEDALRVAQEIGDKGNEGLALGNLANVLAALGDLATARSLQERSMQVRERAGDQAGVAQALNNLGGHLLELGAVEEALAARSRSLTIRQHIGDKVGTTHTLVGLAAAHLAAGQVGQALARVNEALDNARELELAEVTGPGLILRGRITFVEGGDGREDLITGLERMPLGSIDRARELVSAAESVERLEPALAQQWLSEAVREWARLGNAQKEAEAATRLAGLADADQSR